MSEEGLLVGDEAVLEKRVAAGDGYECTQLYLGLIGRLRQAGKAGEAEAVGARGARALIAAGQAPNATHVAVKVIESLSDRDAPMDAPTCALLTGLVTAFDEGGASEKERAGGGGSDGGNGGAAGGAAEQKLAVCKEACKLAGPAYAPLHAIRAEALAQAGRHAEAAKHFALAGPAAVGPYASLLVAWAVSLVWAS